MDNGRPPAYSQTNRDSEAVFKGQAGIAALLRTLAGPRFAASRPILAMDDTAAAFRPPPGKQ